MKYRVRQGANCIYVQHNTKCGSMSGAGCCGAGDGTPARTGAQVAHTHALAGQFTAIVTATNSLGQLSTTAEVNVLAAASAKRRLYLPVVRR